jgi:hypothetical protein
VNTGILDTRLRLGNRDRVLLAIASFIIHYLGWQSARGFWGHLPEMATNRQRGFLNAASSGMIKAIQMAMQKLVKPGDE